MALERCFYVDDGLAGTDKLSVALDMKEQLINVCSQAGMKLRKWCSNYPMLLQNIAV